MWVKVHRYWETCQGWKWELLTHLLPVTTLVKLANLVIECDSGIANQFGWLKLGADRFDIKKTYRLKVN